MSIDTIKRTVFPGPRRNATHVRVEITGNVTDETAIFREANHQVRRKVEDKGGVFLVSISCCVKPYNH